MTSSPQANVWRRFRRNRAALASLCSIIFICLVAVFAQAIAPYPFDVQDVDRALNPPDFHNWLGADALGRDLLSRLIYGARASMAVGACTALVSLVIGGAYGLVSGWAGGRLDALMMRAIDVLHAIPSLALMILVKVAFDAYDVFEDPEVKALAGILLALSVVGWASLARLVRAQTLQIKQVLFVESARALGASAPRILLRHVAPNILGPVIVMLTFQIPSNILFESFLSFVGLGLQPPYSSWGTLANDGWRAKSFPHLVIAPGLTLFLTMLAFNLLGDGLRDALDPRSRRR